MQTWEQRRITILSCEWCRICDCLLWHVEFASITFAAFGVNLAVLANQKGQSDITKQKLQLECPRDHIERRVLENLHTGRSLSTDTAFLCRQCLSKPKANLVSLRHQAIKNTSTALFNLSLCNNNVFFTIKNHVFFYIIKYIIKVYKLIGNLKTKKS